MLEVNKIFLMLKNVKVKLSDEIYLSLKAYIENKLSENVKLSVF